MKKTLIGFILVVTIFSTPLSSGMNEEITTSTRLSEHILVQRAGLHPLSPNITAFVSNRGVVVFDTGGDPLTAANARKRIEEEFDRKDFLYVVNTHDHWDHALGNQVFADVTIVAYETCPDIMRRVFGANPHPAEWILRTISQWKGSLKELDPASDQAQDLALRIKEFQRSYDALAEDFVLTLPNLTFSDRMQIDLGSHTLKLYSLDCYETPSDIMAHIPEEGLVIMGDTFSKGRYYAAFERDMNVPKWIEVFDTILGERIDFCVPGHGEHFTRKEFAAVRDYLRETWEGVKAAVDQGLTLDQTKFELALDKGLSHLPYEHLDLEGLERTHILNIAAFWKQLKK